MRFLYSCLFYLALPYIFLRLWWRTRRLPAYKERLGERFGYYSFPLTDCIWVHAVSVGEVVAAIPLIKLLQENYPQYPILVTTMTPTGSARVKAVFGDSVKHVYLPYDLSFAVNRFLKTMQPRISIIMETEIWPNMIAACHERNIPVCLMNARLSEKSARGYQRIASLTKETLKKLTLIAAHGKQDANRFIALGAPEENVMVTGNLKFDLQLPANLLEHAVALRNALGKERFIWIAASTHEGEEEQILAAHQLIREKNPQVLLILVPRHPDRFDEVYKLSQQQFQTVRRSQTQSVNTDTAVYLGDTMGELMLLYAVVDAVFVGGSLVERGGHNVLEPAALDKAILTGPHVFNFKEITQLFIEASALITVNDAQSLASQLISLMQHPAERVVLGERARKILQANRGALEKQFRLIKKVMA